MKKTLLTLLITAVLSVIFCCFFIVDAATYGDLMYSISGGEVTITGCNSFVTSVTIPKTIDGYHVTSIGDYAFLGRPKLTSIVIPDSVTSIGVQAFSDCYSLTSITIPNGVTSVGPFAFWSCSSLTNVTIGSSVKSIGDSAFKNCSSLTNVTIGSSVRSIDSNAFHYCFNLSTVYYYGGSSDWNRISIYSNNSNLTSANIIYKMYVQITNVDTGEKIRYDHTDGNCVDTTAFPEKEHYTRRFFTNEACTQEFDISTPITANTKLYVKYVPTFTYRFLDNNGTVLKEVTADYGTAITPPDVPADKDPYTFGYWEGFETGEILTGNIDFSAVYKYKTYTITVDGYDISANAVYNSDYVITPAQKTDFNFIGYYTQENGGTKVTDENGASLAPYNFPHDIILYPHFTHSFLNQIKFDGQTSAVIGQKNIKQNVLFATEHDAQYLTCTLKFPDVLELTGINALDFAEVGENSRSTENGHTTVSLVCVYDYGGASIPVHATIKPFELIFDVATTASVGEISVEISDASLSGNGDFAFEQSNAAIISILPKPAEKITVSGNASIDAPEKYTATVLPDYTSDKTVTWSVSDEAVAQISSDGILTPLKNGTVTITATAADGSGTYGTLKVDVTAYATLTSLTSDAGEWDTPFDPYKYSYDITVDSDVTEITLTPAFSGGVLSPNGEGLWISGKSMTFPLDASGTVIALHRRNVQGFTDSVYTLNISTNLEKGDVNGDGIVNRKDLLRLAKHFAGHDVHVELWCADVDSDGVLDLKDMLHLAKYFSGWGITLG